MENKFSDLLKVSISSNTGSFLNSKEEAVVSANQQKLAELSTYIQQQEKARQEASTSVASRLGLDPNTNSLSHTLVNAGAAAASRTVDLFSNLTTGFQQLEGAALSMHIPDEVRAARANQLNGKATQADLDLLALPEGELKAPKYLTPFQRQAREGARTNQQRIEAWENVQDKVKGTKEMLDVSSIVDKRDVAKAQMELEADAAGFKRNILGGYDKLSKGEVLSGVGDLASGVGAAFASIAKTAKNNPGAAFQLVVENSPQLIAAAAGPLGMGMTNIPYATDIFNDGVAAYRKSNNGAMPSTEWMQEKAAWAVAAAAAETAGDVVSLGAGKAVKGISGLANKGVDSLEDGFKKSLASAANKAVLANPVSRTASAGVVGAMGEYPTEAFQTYAENAAQDKPTTFEQLHAAGAMGAMAAGPMSSVAALAGERGAVSTKTDDGALTPAQQASRAQSIAAAVQSKDVSSFLDSTKPEAFDPGAALIALNQLATAEGVTPDEKAQYLQQAQEVMTQAEGALTPASAPVVKSPEHEAALADLASVDAMLAKIDPKTDPQRHALAVSTREEIQSAVNEYEKQVATVSKPEVDPVIKTRVESARSMYDQMVSVHAGQSVAGLDSEALAKAVDAPADPANPAAMATATESAKKLQVLAMASPSAVSSATARSLAQNTSNVLSAGQRDFLAKHADALDAQTSLKNKEKVNEEVLYGDRSLNQMGMVTYQERMGKFLAMGDQARAEKLMQGLTSFMQGHQQKAQALQAALGNYQANGVRQQVLKNKDTGQWEVSKLSMKWDALRKQKGYMVDANSASLLEYVKEEAQAIEKTHAALESATALAFPGTTAAPNPTTVSAPTAATTQATTTQPKEDNATTPTNSGTQASTTPGSQGQKTQARAKQPTATSAVTQPDPNVVAAEKAIRKAEKEQRSILRRKPGGSLWASLKGRMTSADVVDIYGRVAGSVPHGYRSLLGKNKSGVSLTTLVADGTLDAWLPFSNRSTSPNFDEQAAEEHIKEKMRGQDYLTEEASLALAQLDYTIQEAEQLLSMKDIDERLDQIEREESQQRSGTTSAGDGIPNTQEPGGFSKEVADTTVELAEGNSAVDQGSENEQQETTGSASESEQVKENKGSSTTLAALKNAQSQIAQWLKQSAGNDAAATKRPLASVENFLSALKKDDSLLGTFLKDADATNTGDAIGFLMRTAEKWGGSFRSALVPAFNEKHYAENPLTFFMEPVKGGADVDENIKTAAVVAGMLWIADTKSKGNFNNAEAINAIFGRKAEEYVSPQAFDRLAGVGVRTSVVTSALGQKAIQALGLVPSPKAPRNLLPKLEAALGSYILSMLQKEGAVTLTQISDQELQRLAGKAEFSAHVVHSFVGLNTNSRTVKDTVDALKGSGNVLEKLFSVESSNIAPTLEPVQFNQDKAKGSTKRNPKWLAKVLNKKNHEENYVRSETFQLLEGMMEEQVALMAGATPQDAAVHVINQKGVEAKRDGLLREWLNFKDFVSDTLEYDTTKPFFFQHTAWINQRVGIVNNLVNPQTSKIHRFLVSRPTWETTVELKWETSGELASSEQMDNFKLRVLEGFGVKTDKQINFVTLTEWKDRVENNPKVQAAVSAILAQKDGTRSLTEDEQQAIVDAVAYGGQNFHSLDALMALAEYRQAKDAGKPSFTTHIIGEVDGVTNGPMLTHMLLGAAKSAKDLFQLVNKGGFFGVGSEHTNYNEYRGTDGVQDLYESVTGQVITNIQQLVGTEDSPQMAALWHFTGNLGEADNVLKDGRNLSKKPITSLLFGSAATNSVNGMTDQFIAGVYAKIEKTAQNDEARAETIRQLNTLLGNGNWQETMTATEVLSRTLTAAEEATLRAQFQSVIGDAAKAALDSYFADLLQKRNTFNSTARLSFNLYNTVRESLRQEMLAKEGLGNGWDLTQEQEAAIDAKLKSAEPVAHTLMSLYSKDLNAGLQMSKRERALSQDELYAATTQFADKGFNGKGSASVHGMDSKSVDPGVAMLVMMIHSLDSAISHRAAMLSEALNIHDAHVIGAGKFKEVAQNLNKATWQSLLDYSPAQEMYNATARSISGILNLLEDPSTSPTVVNAVLAHLSTEAKKNKFTGGAVAFLVSKLEAAKDLAYESDKVRLETLSQMQAIDQYALEGGQYMVTKEDRAEATRRLENLRPAVPGPLIARIQEVLKPREVSPETKAETKAEESPEQVAAEAEAHEDVAAADLLAKTGPVGVPAQKSAPDVVAFLDSLVSKHEGKPTAQNMLHGLKPVLQARRNSPQKAFYLSLLNRVQKAVGADVQVRLVTPSSDPGTVEDPGTPAHGWYDPETKTIFLLSSQFVNSRLSAELLLHEAVHAAIANVLHNPSNVGQKNLVAELNSLLKSTQDFVSSNGITGFDEAVSNIHELVAYGLFNKDFQEKVLNQFTVVSKTHKGLIPALRKFVDTLVNYLFPGSQGATRQGEVTGFVALLSTGATALRMAESTKKTQKQIALHGVRPMAMAAPNHSQPSILEFTTQEVFDALASTSSTKNTPAFTEKLNGVLGTIVNKLHGPFGALKATISSTIGNTPLDAWAHAATTGQRLFAGKVLAANVRFTPQEAYVAEQVEAVVSSLVSERSTVSSENMNQMERLFRLARTELKGKIAPDLYDFVFTVSTGAGNRSDHLSRFVALALANEEFNKNLDFPVQDTQLNLAGKTFTEKLETVFNALVDWMSRLVTKSSASDKVNERLERLVTNLVQIEVRHKTKTQNNTLSAFLEPIEAAMEKAMGGVRQGVVSATQSSFVRKSTFSAVRLTAAAANIAASGRAGTVLQGIQQIHAQSMRKRPGVAMGLLNYVNGIPRWTGELLRATKVIEGERKHIINDTAKAVLESFKDNGAYLTTKSKAAVTSVLLRSGAYVLLDSYGIGGIQSFLENQADLSKAIAKEEASLASSKNRHYYIMQAKGLAWHKVEGRAVVAELNLNAGNIAKLYGTGLKVPADAATHTQAIERLVALYALQYSDSQKVVQARDVMRTEAQRGNQNGVLMALTLHRGLEDHAAKTLFSGSEALRLHGFMPEVLNPHVAVDVARDVAKAKELEEQGYVEVGRIPHDPKDPNKQDAVMYKLVGAGLTRRQTGMVSYTGNQAKGNAKHPEGYNPLNPAGTANRQSMTAIYQGNRVDVRKQFLPNPGFDPRKETSNLLVPLLTKDGDTKDYRYMMKESVRDNHLERNNDFEHLLGLYAATTYDKVASRAQNKEVIQALYQSFKSGVQNNPARMAHVHHTSSDPDMREIWKLLPEATRKDIEAVWGVDGMYVPYDLVDVTFGYSKGTLSYMFDKEFPNKVEKAFTEVVGYALRMYGKVFMGLADDEALKFSKRGAVVVRRTEDGAQEIVKIIKDTIVVKSLVVLRDNIISNTFMLVMNGVSLNDIVKHQFVALRGAMLYERDRAKLANLKIRKATWNGMGVLSDVESEIALLEDSIAKNPIKGMIDAGMMPTIVEDIGTEEDPYSYRSKLSEWADEKTQWVNPKVKQAANMLMLGHDTGLYKFLSKTTQYSDFVARYALYQHLTNRKKNPLSAEDALQHASDAFVNYDIPLPKWVQYSDDMFLTPFIKYKLSIQRVLFRNFRDNPLQVVNGVAWGNWLGDAALPTDSSILLSVGNNPMNSGVLALPNALSKLPTFQASMALIK